MNGRSSNISRRWTTCGIKVDYPQGDVIRFVILEPSLANVHSDETVQVRGFRRCECLDTVAGVVIGALDTDSRVEIGEEGCIPSD